MRAAAHASELEGHGDALMGLGFASSSQASDGSSWLVENAERYAGYQLRTFTEDWRRARAAPGRPSADPADPAAVLFLYAQASAQRRVLRAPRLELGTRLAMYAQRSLSIVEAKGGYESTVQLAATDRRAPTLVSWQRQALAPPGACVLELAAFGSAVPTDLLGSIRRELAMKQGELAPAELSRRVYSACHRAQQVVIDSVPLFSVPEDNAGGAGMQGWSDVSTAGSARGIPAAALLGLAATAPVQVR